LNKVEGFTVVFGCAFRGHPARDSDLIRPLIPI